MRSERITFTNAEGIELSGRLELPLNEKPLNFAIFAHCFTCSKDLRAVRNITLALCQKGFGVLRFDFTGLGQSGGDFENTNFTSNVNDIQAAADFLKDNFRAPDLLVGHSLGGTAVLMAGSKMEHVKAIATIGAPSDPEHVLNMLREDMEEIRKQGKATVTLAGREFKITSQFVEDVQEQALTKTLEEMRNKSVLILHSPQDETVEVGNARQLYEILHHPKSFISLDGADHLLSDSSDSLYAGDVIAAWVQRYIAKEEKEPLKTDEQIVALLDEGPFLTEILAGPHHLLADEPIAVGGSNLGPTPYEFIGSGLGACTAMTIKMYSDRKGWPLEEVKVHLSYDSNYLEDCEQCESEDRKIGKFERIVELRGDLDKDQRQRLLQIAEKCPVHKTLHQGVSIETRLKEV